MIDLSMKETENGTLVIRLKGRLDVDSNEYFLECVQGWIEEGYRNIVINCSGLGYVSSLGLGTLVRIRSRLAKDGGDIYLARVQSLIMDLLRLVSLDRMLKIYPRERDAIEAIESED